MENPFKKTISGKDLASYISKNPNRNVKITKGANELAAMLPQAITQTEQPKKRGFFGSVIKSLTDPFVNLGRGALEIGTQAVGGEKGKYLSEEEMKDPLGFALKNIAGAGSFFIPAGVGLKGAAALGGVSGALDGLSQSDLKDPSDVLEKVGSGALFGGATVGLFNKLFGKAGKKVATGVAKGGVSNIDNAIAAEGGGIFKKLGQKGKDIERGMTGIKPGKTPTGLLQAEEFADDFINITAQRGVKPNARGMGEAYKAITKDLGSVLPDTANLVDNTGVLDNIQEVVTREAIDIGSKQNDKLMTSLLGKIDSAEGNPRKIANLITELDNDLKTAYAASESAIGRALNDSEKIRMATRRYLSDTLKKSIPESAPLYKELDTLNRVAKDVTSKKPSGLKIPFSNINVPLPEETIKGSAAKLLQGKLPGSGIASGIKGNVTNITSKPVAQQIARTGVTSGITDQMTQGTPQLQISPIQRQLIQSIYGENLSDEQMAEILQGGIQPQDTGVSPEQEALMKEIENAKNNLYINLIENGMSPEDAQATADQLYSSTTGGNASEEATIKRTEKQTQFMNSAESAQRALDLLESGEAGSGKLQALESKIGGFLGTTNETQTDYKSQLALARGLAMNALAGANISPSEAKRIADSIPNESDEPKIAKQKLKSFIQQMQSFSQ